MQKKDYYFELPRSITREQWKKIHGGARKMRQKDGGINRIADKYGVKMLHVLTGHAIAFFWELASHKKYDRDFFGAAIRGNSQGLTSSRTGGMVKSVKDPSHPCAGFFKGGAS